MRRPRRSRDAAGRRRSLRRLAVAALFVGAGVLLWAPGAGAHALIESSEPADGARLERAPEQVTITFTEEPEPAFTEVRVLDGTGSVVSTGPATVVDGSPGTVRVPVGSLDDGVYTVTWRVVSRVDGHATAGSFAFGIGVAPGRVESPAGVPLPETPPPSPLEIAGRWLLFVGLGLVVGAAWIGALAFPEPPGVVVVAGLVAWAVAVAGLVALAQGQRSSAEVGLGAFLGSSLGRAVLLRGAALAVAGGGLIAARARLPAGRIAMGVAGVGALLAVLFHVAAGHANSAGTLRPLKVFAQWAHVSAAGIWLGGLAVLLLGVRGAANDRKAAAVRRFSRVALVALFVVLVTGVFRSVTEVPSWGALFSTLYGRLVLVKLSLLAVLLVLGAVNRYRNVPVARSSLTGLRRVARGEIAVAVAALVAAAVLASVAPPPRVQAASAPPPGVTATGSDFGRTVRVSLRVTPGVAGSNRFSVALTDPSSGAPVEAQRVALTFSYQGVGEIGGSTVEMEPAGEAGRYRASGADLAIAGPWRVEVLVQRGTNSVEVGLVVGTRCGARAIPGDPTLYDVTTPAGTAQGYLDPVAPGPSEAHITYFNRAGTELRVRDPAAVATGPDGDSIHLEPRRLSRGHFVASVDLTAGKWRFDFTGVGARGILLPACFEETVG